MKAGVKSKMVRAERSYLADDLSWADRCAFWLKKSTPKPRRFMRRAGIRQPLILSGHGVRLRVDHGSLLVQDGFTHYPQQRETWRFFPGEWRLPERIVVLDADGGITFDALTWLARHDVPLVQINWRGEVINVVGSRAKSNDQKLLTWQQATQKNSAALQFAKEMIRKKIVNSINTLQSLPKSETIDLALRGIRQELRLLTRRPPTSLNRLLGIEGKVGLAYFQALRTLPVRWRRLDRHPIPDDWHWFGRRASKFGDMYHPNRNATHPVQAILNYAYGILESHVRMQIVAAGLNPKIGFFHGSDKKKDGLVYDLMEPFRPLVDRKLLEFVQSHAFYRSDFSIRIDGVCRLNPEMANYIVGRVVRSNEIFSTHYINVAKILSQTS
jgi:CRISP-associated protein Cas1